MKWYCTSLEEIYVTGCSDVTRGILLEPQDNALQEHGTPLKRAIDITIIDSLEKHCIIKELLTPWHFSKHLSSARSRIEEFLNKGGPVNISHDGWTFFHTASATGDERLISWLLNTGNSKFHSEGSRKPSALQIAIYRHDAAMVKLLFDARETTANDPCKFVKMLLRSSDVSNILRHVGKASAPNPGDLVTFFMEKMSLELKKKLLIEIFKTLERSFHDVKEKIPTVEDILAELLKKLIAMGCSPDISIPELHGKTLLMCSVSSPVLVNTLLDLGASTCIKDAEGNSELFFCSKRDRTWNS